MNPLDTDIKSVPTEQLPALITALASEQAALASRQALAAAELLTRSMGQQWVDWKHLIEWGLEHTPMNAQRAIKKMAEESGCKSRRYRGRLQIPYAVYARQMDKES